MTLAGVAESIRPVSNLPAGSLYYYRCALPPLAAYSRPLPVPTLHRSVARPVPTLWLNTGAITGNETFAAFAPATNPTGRGLPGWTSERPPILRYRLQELPKWRPLRARHCAGTTCRCTPRSHRDARHREPGPSPGPTRAT